LTNSFGEDFFYASKRRQGGKLETHSDLVINRDGAEVLEIAMAVVGGE
jgi:hypothetical protein